MSAALIRALRVTAERLESGSRFEWGHQGACICGNLAQTITHASRAEIHAFAMEKAGDWGDHAVEYCPTSGLPIDHILSEMIALGLNTDDIRHLERLSDPAVLAQLPVGERDLRRESRQDAIRYLRAMAAVVEACVPERPDSGVLGVRSAA